MCNIAEEPPRAWAPAGRRAPLHPHMAKRALRIAGSLRLTKPLAGAAVLLALAGCAQLSESPATLGTPAPAGAIASFTIPPDALGARDAQLAAVLAKAGTLAARQKQPAIVVITALAQDLPYLNQAIWKGVPAQRTVAVHLENLTAGTNQPYSVTIKPAQ